MAELNKGDKAPQVYVDNEIVRKYSGKKIVLYFYPKDDTPGCTQEACNLRDNYEILQQKGYVVLGVSADSEVAHEKFRKKHNLPFELIPDTEKKIIEAFGVWGEKKMYGKSYFGIIRTTFIIDENNVILDIIKKVDTKNHTNQIIPN